MKTLTVVFAAALLAASSVSLPAHADTGGSFIAAGDYLAGCRVVRNAPVDAAAHGISLPDDDPEALMCMGAMSAARDFFLFAYAGGNPRIIPTCMPERTNPPELATIFVRYVETHPAERTGRFGVVMFDAVHDAFPCPGQKK
ncbi:MAG TPA: Rap1a/Tai family immunity protein [Alphaproteobacteria bacterium]|nr:Rap1a/Tai family immunity protein [Alphaproteobacteria bacterium]